MKILMNKSYLSWGLSISILSRYHRLHKVLRGTSSHPNYFGHTSRSIAYACEFKLTNINPKNNFISWILFYISEFWFTLWLKFSWQYKMYSSHQTDINSFDPILRYSFIKDLSLQSLSSSWSFILSQIVINPFCIIKKQEQNFVNVRR